MYTFLERRWPFYFGICVVWLLGQERFAESQELVVLKTQCIEGKMMRSWKRLTKGKTATRHFNVIKWSHILTYFFKVICTDTLYQSWRLYQEPRMRLWWHESRARRRFCDSDGEISWLKSILTGDIHRISWIFQGFFLGAGLKILKMLSWWLGMAGLGNGWVSVLKHRHLSHLSHLSWVSQGDEVTTQSVDTAPWISTRKTVKIYQNLPNVTFEWSKTFQNHASAKTPKDQPLFALREIWSERPEVFLGQRGS